MVNQRGIRAVVAVSAAVAGFVALVLSSNSAAVTAEVGECGGAEPRTVLYQGAPYVRVGSVAEKGLGKRRGLAFPEDCRSSADPLIPVYRVSRVSGRLALAMRVPGVVRPQLFVRDGHACAVAGRPWKCVVRATRRHQVRVWLAAPLSASSGARIPLSLRAPTREKRHSDFWRFGVLDYDMRNYLLAREGSGWRFVFRMQYGQPPTSIDDPEEPVSAVALHRPSTMSVFLPSVPPGTYRIAKKVYQRGYGEFWVSTPIYIRPSL